MGQPPRSDMDAPLTRLFPGPGVQRPLQGCYLGHELHRQGSAGRPLVYTSFITSLDGRISDVDPATGRHRVPPAIANERDWRLFLELAAQAELLLTTARHLRAVTEDRYRDMIDPGAAHAGLARWRRAQGLAPQPALAALSMGLDFPVRAVREAHRGPMLVITGRAAPAARVRELQGHGIEVVAAGDERRVKGAALVSTLRRRRWRSVFSVAGPAVLHTLLEADALDRLYLSIGQVVLGGEQGHTLTRGAPLDPPRGFDLRELHHDPAAPPGAGQLLACFERRRQG